MASEIIIWWIKIILIKYEISKKKRKENSCCSLARVSSITIFQLFWINFELLGLADIDDLFRACLIVTTFHIYKRILIYIEYKRFRELRFRGQLRPSDVLSALVSSINKMLSTGGVQLIIFYRIHGVCRLLDSRRTSQTSLCHPSRRPCRASRCCRTHNHDGHDDGL